MPTSSRFVSAMNTTRTENGALTLKSSGNKNVDLFAQAGASRSWSDIQVENAFAEAYREDKLTATKIAFYLRDIRGGQGERKVFRTIANWMAYNDPATLVANLENIAFYGRWDDLIELVQSDEKTVADAALAIVKRQLDEDKVSENPSLLGKWMPSANASSRDTKKKAKKIRVGLDLSERQYRKLLTSLREKIKVVEAQMCANNWNEIDYQRVPSKASAQYRKAFSKHDGDRYGAYLTAVEKGEAKINAGAIMPYEIVRPIIDAVGWGRSAYRSVSLNPDFRTLEAQWKALKDFTEGNGDAIVVADTSGSMQGDPIKMSVALAIYFAERNHGPFKDAWINFSANPSFQLLKGDTLAEKIKNLDWDNWDQNTDFNAVFRLVLDRAISAGLKQEDLPKAIYVISDMQFDRAGGNKTNFEQVKADYAAAGYEVPTLIFWNVNARAGQSPVEARENNVVLVSGASPSTFAQVVGMEQITPYDLMMKVISTPRYDRVVLA